jgi:hypothetical protein
VIGFELHATGSNGYRRESASWTEGSLVALKVALAIPKVNPPGIKKAQSKAISGIEASFKQLADAMFDNVCGIGLDFTLVMTGDIELRYRFESRKTSEQTKSELINLIASKTEKIGDQVMIHICRNIQEFVMLNFNSTSRDLMMNIDIDL